MITLSARDVDLDHPVEILAPPERQRFRAVLAEVARDAKQALPPAVNGRVESACQLILRGDVLLQDDGSAVVGSHTAAETTYTVRGGNRCDCPDAAHRPELQGWCKHAAARAMAISLHRRLIEAPPTTPPTPPPPPPVPPALPEAPCSVNVHLTVAGRPVQITLRGHDEQEVLRRLETVLACYPVDPPAAPQAPAPNAPLCPDGHGPMRPSKKGIGFYCAHKIDGNAFCRQKSV